MYPILLPVSIASSITPRPALRRPQLIHLRNSLLELLVLAFLITMSLVLYHALAAVSPWSHMLVSFYGIHGLCIGPARDATQYTERQEKESANI